jgi:hypothetical protein
MGHWQAVAKNQPFFILWLICSSQDGLCAMEFVDSICGKPVGWCVMRQ